MISGVGAVHGERLTDRDATDEWALLQWSW
jgi:hypothetical protein